MAIVSANGRRPWTFYLLAAIFTLYVLFLYGPMVCIYILSFQGPHGGLGFPMRGFGLHWFEQLLSQRDTGDLMGAISRSLPLALLVMVLTVAISFAAGMAFRIRFFGSGPLFFLVIASLVAPGYVLSIGIGLMFQLFGWETDRYTSALGAQLSWTLPFGLLIMFAVFSRFGYSYEAARDLGARPLQTIRLVVIPILLPGVIAVALFGFTLSYQVKPESPCLQAWGYKASCYFA